MFALLLASLLSTTSPEPAPAVLYGGRAAPGAWLAIARGALWICWDDGARRGALDPDCWRRVELPIDVEPRELRATFLDAGTALLRGPDGRTQQISRGDATAQPVDAIGVEPRERLAAIACSPIGQVPIYTRGRWAWRDAPCAVAVDRCVAPPQLPRLRRPTWIGLTFGVEVRVREHRSADAGARAIASAELVASLGASFDPTGWLGRRIAWQDLQTARRPRLRALPDAGDGPLAGREREALVAALCGGHVR